MKLSDLIKHLWFVPEVLLFSPELDKPKYLPVQMNVYLLVFLEHICFVLGMYAYHSVIIILLNGSIF